MNKLHALVFAALALTLSSCAALDVPRYCVKAQVNEAYDKASAYRYRADGSRCRTVQPYDGESNSVTGLGSFEACESCYTRGAYKP